MIISNKSIPGHVGSFLEEWVLSIFEGGEGEGGGSVGMMKIII